MNSTNLNFEKIDNPYDYNLNRANSDIFSMGGQKFNSEGLPSVDTSEDKSSDSKQVPGAGSTPGGNPTVPMQEDLWISNWIKSRNYKPKSQGFLIDGRLGYIECMKLYVGTGGIVGGSINIPNVENPQFSVDSDGNARVNSLERNDYHWFTMFESIDGYTKTPLVEINVGQVNIRTSSVSGNQANFFKSIAYAPINLTWSKNRKMRTKIYFLENTNQIIFVVTGDMSGASSGNHIGFKATNNTLYGTVGDGSAETSVNLGTFSAAVSLSLEFRYIAGEKVDFFVDNILTGTITSNLPSGTTYANYIMENILITNENAEKRISLSFWDFWQAN